MDEAWGKLEEGKERMEEVELRPRTDEEGVIKLNKAARTLPRAGTPS